MKILLLIFSFLFFIIAFIIADTAIPVLAQTAPIKSALQSVADSLEQISKISSLPKDKNQKAEELIARKIIFKNILALALAEANNLKNKLIDLKNLNGDFLKLRDQSLKELDNHANYYKSINDSLDNDGSLLKINNLTQQFKNWRKVVYHGALEKIVNFLLVLETRDILERSQRRFDKIASDLKKIEDLELIKKSPLSALLEKAEGALEEARQTQKAAEIVLTKSAENSTQELSGVVLEKIKEVYDYFLKMSEWVKKKAK